MHVLHDVNANSEIMKASVKTGTDVKNSKTCLCEENFQVGDTT